MRTKSHPLHEDIVALLSACLLVSVGLALFQQKGMISPGAAGIAMIFDALSPLNFGQLFFIINLPFYCLGYHDLGKEFIVKTIISVTLLSIMTQYMPLFVHFDQLSYAFATTVGGVCIGFGVLIMFRHNSSLGGLGILAFYLQKRWGVSAGKFLMVMDAVIVSGAFFLSDFTTLIFSILATVILNMLLALNNKEGRYQVV